MAKGPLIGFDIKLMMEIDSFHALNPSHSFVIMLTPEARVNAVKVQYLIPAMK